MDPLEKVFDVNALLSSVTPAQLFMVFILPIFLSTINKRLVAFLTKVYNLAPVAETSNTTVVVNDAPQRLAIAPVLMPVLDLLTKIFRPILIFFFLSSALSYVSAIWVYAQISPSRNFAYALYLIFFTAAGVYNVLMISNKNHSEKRLKIQKISGHIYMPVMYVLVFVALYFLAFENFFSLLVYSRVAEGLPLWIGILLLSIPLVPATVILRDMLQPNPTGIRAILAFMLCSCIICYLLMIAGFCYKSL